MKGWYGNSMKHGLASKGIRTKNDDYEKPPISFKERKEQILYYLGRIAMQYKEEYDKTFEEYGDEIEDFQIYDDYPKVLDCINEIKYSANNIDDVKRIMLEYKLEYMNDELGIRLWLNQILIGD